MLSSVPRLATVALAALALTLTGVSSADARERGQSGQHASSSAEHGQKKQTDQKKQKGKHAKNHVKTKHTKKHQNGQQPVQQVLATDLVSPLRAAVADDGTTYVSQNFAGVLLKVKRNGSTTPVYTDPNGYEVGGVSVSGRVVTFTVTQLGSEGFPVDSWLKRLYPDGRVRTVAHVRAYENERNPDSTTTYGFRDDPVCGPWDEAENGPATYTGVPDSHPYATYALPNGWTYVADAGANAVFLVSPRGRIRTVATLPAIPYTITAQGAAALELDPCFVGATYWFEPVPTDIEPAGHGRFYVSSLPGGPEGPQLGARGSVFLVDPARGRATQVVTGLLGPTGLAVDRSGSLYVAQMFGDVISKVTLRRGRPVVRDFLTTTVPAEVESGPRGLYFTDNAVSDDEEAPPAGRLVLYRK